MDCVNPENDELFTFADENDLGSFMGTFDDILKDPLLSWASAGSDDQDLMLGLSDASTTCYQETVNTVLTSTPGHQPLYDMKVVETNSAPALSPDGSLRFVKIEPRKVAPELVRLLSNAEQAKELCSGNMFVNSDGFNIEQTNMVLPCSQPGQQQSVQPLQQQTVQMLQPATTVQTSQPVMAVPIQSVPLQTQKLLVSPQQTCSAQMRSLLPNYVDTTSKIAVTLPTSYQPLDGGSPVFTGAQFVTATTQQLPVQQLVLHATQPSSGSAAAVTRPIQLVIDPSQLSQLPLVTSSVVTAPIPVPPATPLTPRVEKRAHNAIEKKYRTSINDKIAEMRKLLFGADAKIQKSGVLKKAVDHIRQLRNTNARLRQENMAFRIKLQQMGILSCDKPEDAIPYPIAPLTPESIGDVPSSCASSAGSPPSSPSCKSDDSLMENAVMSDTTRVGLCIIMMSFFVFDPFNLVYSWQQGAFPRRAASSPAHASGRLLMSDGPMGSDIQPFDWSMFVFYVMSWLFRSFVVGFLFLKVFVFGEPAVEPASKTAAKYWSFKTQADIYLGKGDYIAGSKVLRRCLETIGRPLPTSRLDIVFSLVWQILKQVVYRLWIVRWLAKNALRYFSRSVDTKEKELRQQSAKEASIVHHKLHQLYLTGCVPGNSSLATIISLNAVNLAEMADMKEEQLVEIYINAAIQLRSTLPTHFQFLARYFLGRARRLCRGQSLTLPYSCWWLFTPVGHRFFVSGQWSCKEVHDVWNSSNNNENKPLVNVTQTFCRYLLEQALSSLLIPSKDQNIPESTNTEDNNGRIQALDMLHTLTECVNNSRTSNINRNVKVFGEVTCWPSQEANVAGCWWSAICKSAVCWLTGDLDGAEKQRKIIEDIPHEIENNDDPIGQALLMAFMARAKLLRKDEHADEILDDCDRGGALLKESIAFASVSPANNLLKLMQLLCCDWLLSTRVELWEREEHDSSTSTNCQGFDKDLKSLQNICFDIPEAMTKVYMYQATQRMMTGANPLRTCHLLQKMNHGFDESRAVQRGTKVTQGLSARKDRATALLMASSYLPASLFANSAERKGMVREALESLQALGEQDRVARCRKLLLSI